MTGLTDRQKQAFEFIAEKIMNDICPSMEEIACHMGTVKSGAYRVVESLVERGYLTKIDGRARALGLTGKGLLVDQKPQGDVAAYISAFIRIIIDGTDFTDVTVVCHNDGMEPGDPEGMAVLGNFDSVHALEKHIEIMERALDRMRAGQQEVSVQ